MPDEADRRPRRLTIDVLQVTAIKKTKKGGICPAIHSALEGRLPHYPLAGAVAVEVNEPIFVASIETLDRVAQTAFCVLRWMGCERIEDSSRPVFFLKRHQNQLLIHSAPLESFDDLPAEGKDSSICLPNWHRRYSP